MLQPSSVILRQLSLQPYLPVSDAMHRFTEQRTDETIDEIWLVQHFPVFTQGRAGKVEHLLNPGDIPVIQSDRGGQVTYHGPGQQILYVLIDLKRKQLGVRDMVSHLENCVMQTLKTFDIEAYARADAPGVYCEGKKICSLGLRISKGCTLHGLSLNVSMEMTPFLRINPCGYAGLEMMQMRDTRPDITPDQVSPVLVQHFVKLLRYDVVEQRDWKIQDYD